MNKQHITKDVFLERLNEKYSEKITYVDTAFDYYDKELDERSKKAILQHTKTITLDKVSASKL